MTLAGQWTGQQRGQQRDKEEDKEILSTEVDSAIAPNLRQELFNEGLASVRRQTGKPEDTTRRLLGRWLKSANDDAAFVLTTVRQAEADQRADMVAWTEAAIASRFDRKKPRAKTARDMWARM